MFLSEPKSKSERKREAEAVEGMVFELIQLSPAQISGLPCGEDLRQEILDARLTAEHGARRRQIKYVAKLLRDTDRQALMEVLDETKGLGLKEAQEFRHLEKLRGWLLGDETGEALSEIARILPSADMKKLENLAERYRRTGNRRFSRELFQQLRTAAQREAKNDAARSPSDLG